MRSFRVLVVFVVGFFAFASQVVWAGGRCEGGCFEESFEINLPAGLSRTDKKALREWARLNSEWVEFEFYAVGPAGDAEGKRAYFFEVPIGSDKVALAGIMPGQYKLVTRSNSYKHGYLLQAENLIAVRAGGKTPVVAKFSLGRTIEFDVSVAPEVGDFVEGGLYRPQVDHGDDNPFSESRAMEYRDGRLHGRFYVYDPEQLFGSQQMKIVVTDEGGYGRVMTMDFEIMEAIKSESGSVDLVQDPVSATGSVSVTFGFEDEVDVEESGSVTVEVAKDTPVSGYVTTGSNTAALAKFVLNNSTSEDVTISIMQLLLKGTVVSSDVSSVFCRSERKSDIFESGNVNAGYNDVFLTTEISVRAETEVGISCYANIDSDTSNHATVSLAMGSIAAVDALGNEVEIVHLDDVGNMMTILNAVMSPSFLDKPSDSDPVDDVGNMMTILNAVMSPSFLDKPSDSDPVRKLGTVNDEVARLRICADGVATASLNEIVVSAFNRGEAEMPADWMIRSFSMTDEVDISTESKLAPLDGQVRFEMFEAFDTRISSGVCRDFAIIADTTGLGEGEVVSVVLNELSWILPDGTVATTKYGGLGESDLIRGVERQY